MPTAFCWTTYALPMIPHRAMMIKTTMLFPYLISLLFWEKTLIQWRLLLWIFYFLSFLMNPRSTVVLPPLTERTLQLRFPYTRPNDKEQHVSLSLTFYSTPSCLLVQGASYLLWVEEHMPVIYWEAETGYLADITSWRSQALHSGIDLKRPLRHRRVQRPHCSSTSNAQAIEVVVSSRAIGSLVTSADCHVIADSASGCTGAPPTPPSDTVLVSHPFHQPMSALVPLSPRLIVMLRNVHGLMPCPPHPQKMALRETPWLLMPTPVPLLLMATLSPLVLMATPMPLPLMVTQTPLVLVTTTVSVLLMATTVSTLLIATPVLFMLMATPAPLQWFATPVPFLLVTTTVPFLLTATPVPRLWMATSVPLLLMATSVPLLAMVTQVPNLINHVHPANVKTPRNPALKTRLAEWSVEALRPHSVWFMLLW